MKKKVKKSAEPETVLVLRTCAKDGSSTHDFEWPMSGPVEARDWKPTKECGNGLHGWLWGSGDWSLKVRGDDILWLVVEVEAKSIVDLGGKVKFPRGNVSANFAAWNDAMAFIRSRRPTDETTNVATGYSGHASATGDSGHASATGDYGHASATGYSGWAIGGYGSYVKADKNGALTALWFDQKANRPRVAVAYVGEDGIKANTWYEVKDGKFVEVK